MKTPNDDDFREYRDMVSEALGDPRWYLRAEDTVSYMERDKAPIAYWAMLMARHAKSVAELVSEAAGNPDKRESAVRGLRELQLMATELEAAISTPENLVGDGVGDLDLLPTPDPSRNR